jgi:purine-binding chemotaxis protein CheW
MAEITKLNEHGTQPYELISFLVKDQEFCVDIMAVREIRGWTTSTVLPHSPDFVLGVINLRGVVLPVIDLGARLGLGRSEPTSSHVIVVVQIRDNAIGMLVNAVCDILTVTDEMLQRPPRLGDSDLADMVIGIMTVEGRMITHLALDSILPEDMAVAVAA